MHGKVRHRQVLGDQADQVPGSPRGPDPDGVAERDLVAAEIAQGDGEVGDGGRRYGPLVGAAEDAGDVSPHAQFLGQGALGDRTQPLDRLRDRAIDVRLGEGVGRGSEDGDLARSSGECGIEALSVRH